MPEARIELINGDSPTVSIIIPVISFDDEITKKCLDNLRSNVSVPAKVILVQSSGSGFSFGRSINFGFAQAEGFEVVICMDSDAFPEKGAVEAVCSRMMNDPRLGYVGAKIQVVDSFPRVGFTEMGLLEYIYCAAFQDKAPLYLLRRLVRGHWQSFGVRDVSEFASGRVIFGATSTFIGVRRRCWEDVGGFDEEYRIQYADVDFCYRVLLSEWYLTTCLDARVFHDIHKSQKKQGIFHGFPGLDRYAAVWDRKKMKDVRKAARAGKFLIPSE